MSTSEQLKKSVNLRGSSRIWEHYSDAQASKYCLKKFKILNSKQKISNHLELSYYCGRKIKSGCPHSFWYVIQREEMLHTVEMRHVYEKYGAQVHRKDLKNARKDEESWRRKSLT